MVQSSQLLARNVTIWMGKSRNPLTGEGLGGDPELPSDEPATPFEPARRVDVEHPQSDVDPDAVDRRDDPGGRLGGVVAAPGAGLDPALDLADERRVPGPGGGQDRLVE